MLLATLLRLAKLIGRTRTENSEPTRIDQFPYTGHVDVCFFYQPPAEPAEPDPNTTQEK